MLSQTPAGRNALACCAAALGAIALGIVLEFGNGYWVPWGGHVIAATLLAPLVALMVPASWANHRLVEQALPIMLGCGIVLQLSFLTSFPPAKYLQLHSLLQLWPMHACIAAMTLLSFAWSISGQQRLCRRLWALCFVGLGVWLITYSPAPHMDVYVFGRDAALALLRGENPYAHVFPNIYGKASGYAVGCADNQSVWHGYPYPPINLVVACAGLLLGDMRYGLVGCLLVVLTLMLSNKPTLTNAWAALALFVTPRCLMLLEQGFVEPLGMALVAMCAWSQSHRPRWTPYCVGLLWATKQSMVVAVPAALLLPAMRSSTAGCLWPDYRAWGRALATTAATLLPFALLSPAAFWMGIWRSQQPSLDSLKPDSLTLTTPWAHEYGQLLPLWLSFVLVAGVAAIVLMRAPRTASGFALATGLLTLAFFICNRQARANYYHLVLACFLISIAFEGWQANDSSDRTGRPLRSATR